MALCKQVPWQNKKFGLAARQILLSWHLDTHRLISLSLVYGLLTMLIFMFVSSAENGICLTKDKYEKTDSASAQTYCESIGLSLCSLSQMYAAWMKNYYDPRWGMYDKTGRDAKVTPCEEWYIEAGECYASARANLRKYNLIPNTPRPSDKQHAYCCQ